MSAESVSSGDVITKMTFFFLSSCCVFLGASQEFTLADAIDSLRVVRSSDVRVLIVRVLPFFFFS